jgi:hypothetical protein
LHYLINQSRLDSLIKLGVKERTLLVYSFVHKNKGLSYFYSADEGQLKENPEFMRDFLGFAASKATFAITLLSCVDIPKSKAYAPLTLSDSLTKKDTHLNLPPSEEVLSIIDKFSCMLMVSDITDKTLQAQYQALNYENIDTSLLKKFGHKRLIKAVPVNELGINYKNQRQEQRFKYKTPAIVETKSLKYSGASSDFSISGLQIELDKGTVINKGDIVHLSFPALQKITSAFDLKKLPYEIVRVNKNKNVINLRIYVKQHQHIGRAFFKLLIDKNKDKLTPDEYTNMIPGLAKALRTLYASCIRTPSLLIQTSGSRYKTETIAASDVYGNLLPQMSQLSDQQHKYNLYPLLNNLKAANLLYSHLKKMLVADHATTTTLYIAINHEKEQIEQAVTTKLDGEFVDNKQKNTFMRNALKQGSFFCLQLKLSRTVEPDMDYLNPELSYIGSQLLSMDIV